MGVGAVAVSAPSVLTSRMRTAGLLRGHEDVLLRVQVEAEGLPPLSEHQVCVLQSPP